MSYSISFLLIFLSFFSFHTHAQVNAGADTTVCVSSPEFSMLGLTPAGGSWTGTAISAQGVFNPLISGAGAFTVTYSASVGGVPSTDTKRITVLDVTSIISATGTREICQGAKQSLSANLGSGLTYQWRRNNVNISGAILNTFDATTAGTYTVAVTNAVCTAVSEDLQLIVRPLPFNDLGGDFALCNAQTKTIGFSQPSVTYSWLRTPSATPIATTATITVNQSGTYILTATNSFGCTKKDTVIVLKNVNPVGTFALAAENCNGRIINLDPVFTGENVKYKWSIVNGVGEFGDIFSKNTIYRSNKSDGEKSVIISVEVSNVCDTVVVSKNTTFKKFIDPKFSATAETDRFYGSSKRAIGIDSVIQIVDGEKVAVKANAATAEAYRWDFNGEIINAKDTSFQLKAVGEYSINLRVTDFGGCTNTFSQLVKVYEHTILYIPNAFSPTSKNPENRIFKIFGEDVSDAGFEFKIYNRWGEIVYEAKTFKQVSEIGWDGTSKSGNDLGKGVYTYTIKGTYSYGETIDRLGIITLLD